MYQSKKLVQPIPTMIYKHIMTLVAASAIGVATSSAALVVHYTLDDDGGGAISSINEGTSAHTWNSSSGATLTTGKFGEAGAFVTTSQWWSAAATGADLSSFTFSMHIRSAAPLNWQDYASIGDGNNSAFRFEHNGANNGVSIYTSGTPGGGAVTIGGTGPAVNDGNWHHLAMVSNGSTLELFVDGVSAGSAAYTGSGSIDALQLAALFGGGRDQNADIDDVAIYDTALSGDQIAWLTNNQAISSVPVPEPSSFALLSLGGILLMRRRR